MRESMLPSRFRSRLVPTALVLLMIPLSGATCPKAKVRVPGAPGGTTVPVSNIYLRTAPDKDPSPYLGRFVPEDTDASEIDESSAMTLPCSKQFKWRYVEAAGSRDEYFLASTGARLSVGIPALADVATPVDVQVGATYKRGAVVRAKYNFTGKMIAEPIDPEALEACCEKASGRCTSRYVSEFIEGTGQIFQGVKRAAGGDATVGVKQVEVGIEIKDGVEWHQTTEFQEPVYFAFKTSRFILPDADQAGGCDGAWVSGRVPGSVDGQQFVGVSEVVESERVARDVARRDARVQAVQYLGEQITAGGRESRLSSGQIDQLRTRMDQEDFIEYTATGVAELVKDRDYCIQEVETPGGLRYKAKVLALLPNSQLEELEQVIANALEKGL